MPSYVVTLFRGGEPLGDDYVVEANSKAEAITSVEHDHEGVLDMADDVIVVEVPEEASQR